MAASQKASLRRTHRELTWDVRRKDTPTPRNNFFESKGAWQIRLGKNAALTISALEEWFARYVAGVYHQEIHSALLTSPIKQYEKGIFGTKDIPGRGLPYQIHDEDRLRLDLMPAEKRTIQEYGVVIDFIHYYSGVLNKHINEQDENSTKKRKFIFKRDPRNISRIYFFDPDLNEYFKIPYRDTSQPPMSIWEYRKVRRRLEALGKEDIDEQLIFQTFKEMRAIEEREARMTKSKRRDAQRRRQHRQIEEPKMADERHRDLPERNESDELEDVPVVEPFDEMEYLT